MFPAGFDVIDAVDFKNLELMAISSDKMEGKKDMGTGLLNIKSEYSAMKSKIQNEAKREQGFFKHQKKYSKKLIGTDDDFNEWEKKFVNPESLS